MRLIATLRDIQPNGPKPQLELTFARADSGCLSPGRREPLTLRLPSGEWRGTMCNEAHRNAYLHTRLEDGNGRSVTGTELFVALGLGHKASLEFALESPSELRLTRVIDSGSWPIGRSPTERATASKPPSPRTVSASSPREMVATRAHQGEAFPFEDCQAIRRLAETYWTLITPREASEEQLFEQEFEQARRAGFLSKDLFVRVGRWKSVRQTPNYESNTQEQVREASAVALAARSDTDALSALMRLRGVALRTASAILHWLNPRRFPILDVRVVAALGLAEPRSYDDLIFYGEVAMRVRKLADACGVDLRTMDRALWTWDKLRAKA